MGMKANGKYFSGTKGSLRFKLDIQLFATKAISDSGNVTIKSLEKYGNDLLKKDATQIKTILNEKGYECKILPSRKANTKTKIVYALNPSKERNITQIQVSPNGSNHHGNVPYIKISTKNIGIIKIVDGEKSDYKTDGKEKAKILYKGGNKK